MMEDITAASAAALRSNTEMALRDGLPPELDSFQEAIREMTEEIQGYKIDFEDSLAAIRYGDVLNARTLSQDRDFGLENVLMTLRRGKRWPKPISPKSPVSAPGRICRRFWIAMRWSSLYRAGISTESSFYFEAGDTSRFLQVYQYTTSLGEILQKNLDAWYVDETNQLIFEDEAVLDQYNAAYFEMQRLLQDMGGSAVV